MKECPPPRVSTFWHVMPLGASQTCSKDLVSPAFCLELSSTKTSREPTMCQELCPALGIWLSTTGSNQRPSTFLLLSPSPLGRNGILGSLTSFWVVGRELTHWEMSLIGLRGLNTTVSLCLSRRLDIGTMKWKQWPFHYLPFIHKDCLFGNLCHLPPN